MSRAVYAALDWFIPNASTIERSEIGLARNFIITHLFGPFLILSIVLVVFFADSHPQPHYACWAMMGCVATFWTLPFGFKITRDLRLMAIISVELLCVMSLIGTSFYGGVHSPFLPWLLVSLMLGFFYLSDHPLRVLALFAFNIVAMIASHLVFRFPQHLQVNQLAGVSWFSTFAATAYMSLMAIYYAGITTMRSELERDTEWHRLMTQQLRLAKFKADTASHGKSTFLAKMKREFERPLSEVVAASRKVLDAVDREGIGQSWKPDLVRIHATGTRLINLVHDTVDTRNVLVNSLVELESVSIGSVLDHVAATATQPMSAQGIKLLVEPCGDHELINTDKRKLLAIVDTVLKSAARTAAVTSVRVKTRHRRRTTGAWIEITIRAVSGAPERNRSRSTRTAFSPMAPSTDGIEGELEAAQLQSAILGGALNLTREPQGALTFELEFPAASVGTPARLAG